MNDYDLFIGRAVNGFYLLENGGITLFESLDELLKWIESYYLDTEKPSDIEDLYLAYRTQNALKNNGVKRISQLLEMSDIDILRLPNIGKKGLKDIHDALAEARLDTHAEQ